MDTTESERYLRMSDLQKKADKRYPLWLFFVEEHDMTLTEGQLDDIIYAVKKHLANDTPEGHGESSPLEGIVRLTPNDVPKNYLIKALEKLNDKYYTPPHILERVLECIKDKDEPDFNAVINKQ